MTPNQFRWAVEAELRRRGFDADVTGAYQYGYAAIGGRTAMVWTMRRAGRRGYVVDIGSDSLPLDQWTAMVLADRIVRRWQDITAANAEDNR